MKKLMLLLGIFSLFPLSLYSAPDLSNNDYKNNYEFSKYER